MKLTIKEIIQETEDFKTFVFEEGHSIRYEAGQFLTFLHATETGEIRRSYSIVSSPILSEALAIGVKRISNGYFSRYLFDTVRVGDRLETIGAGGFFKLPKDVDRYRKLIFFAAGSGITPILSMIRTALHMHSHLQILLIYSNRSERTTVYLNELVRLEREFPSQLKIEFLFSSSSNLLRARLNRDLLFEFLYEENIDIQETLFFTCGPSAYMRMIIFLLEEFGVEIGRIRKEDFVPAPNTKAHIPPDTGSYLAKITHGDVVHEFKVNYPDSILRAAKKLNIVLPYSCQNGRCGNCAAVCKTGKVWMTTNEVLTDEDLANGLVLTCTGHPLHGDVELEIL